MCLWYVGGRPREITSWWISWGGENSSEEARTTGAAPIHQGAGCTKELRKKLRTSGPQVLRVAPDFSEPLGPKPWPRPKALAHDFVSDPLHAQMKGTYSKVRCGSLMNVRRQFSLRQTSSEQMPQTSPGGSPRGGLDMDGAAVPCRSLRNPMSLLAESRVLEAPTPFFAVHRGIPTQISSAGSAQRSKRAMVAIPELPQDARFVRALLQSEELLKQQASSVFARCDLNQNGQIERDELKVLCEAMHQRIGLKRLDQIELGIRLGKFDDDFSGGLDSAEFVNLYKSLLQDALGEDVCEPNPPARSRSRGRSRVSKQPSLELANLPSDPRYIRAILSSEQLLRQQVQANGQIDRDELFGLCLQLHRKLGLKLPDDIELGVQLARYDEDLSGGLDRHEFLQLYKQLLQESLARAALRLNVGDEVIAPYLGEESGRRYHALVTSVTEEGAGRRFVNLRWLRPPMGQRPK
ncbi:unnamed protein product, partial [Effrenium voratum]